MTPGVLVLAAGKSRRFGSDKRRVLLAEGVSVLDTLVTTLQNSALEFRVCLSQGDDELGRTLDARGVQSIVCPGAGLGMGTTLAEGIAHVSHWPAALIALADMPRIQGDTFRAVAAQSSADNIVVPTYMGKPGHPVGFGSAFFDALRQLSGDQGGRPVIREHAEQVHQLAVKDPAIHWDIDTVQDLAALN